MFDDRHKVKFGQPLRIGCTRWAQMYTVDCIKPAGSRREIGDSPRPQHPEILRRCG